MKQTKEYRQKLKSTRTEYDGLLVHRVTTFSLGDAKPAELREWMTAQNDAFSDYLSTMRKWAGEILRAAGLPDNNRVVEWRPDGTWAERPKDWNTWTLKRQLRHLWEKNGEHRTVAAELERALAEAKKLTLAWHAAQLLSRVEELEDALTQQDTTEAAKCGLRLGESWQRARFAELYELPAAIGLLLSERGERGQKRRVSESVRADWQRQANEFWGRNPTSTKKQVARYIKNKEGFAEHTIRQSIKKS